MSANQRVESREQKDDTATLAALGIVAFVVAVVSHEALGHGLVALLVGAKPVLLTSCYLSTSGVNSRWIPAASGIANVVIGLASLLMLRAISTLGPHLRYFVVLVVAFNLFFAFAYPAYSGIAQFGDWAAVIEGLTPGWVFRVLLIAVGVLGYLLSLRVVAREFQPFLDCDSAHSSARLRRMTLISYLAAIVTAAAAGALNPQGWITLLTAGIPSAACAFGLTQMDHFLVARPESPHERADVITRSVPWILTASVVLVLFIALLGPGIRFGQHP